jgi:putative ABC transport system substrate-binding protein
VFPDPFFTTYSALIFELAASERHPVIYPFRIFPDNGGLISYGINILDQVRRSAFYVDKILKGADPGELPVQAPTKFELVINLKTAKRLVSTSHQRCWRVPTTSSNRGGPTA